MGYKSSKKGIRPAHDFSDEVEFIPLIKTLRDKSNDTTPLTDNYVSLYRNVYDMISSDDDKVIEGLTYDSNRNMFIVTYADGTKEEIPLTDNYLISAMYNCLTNKCTFLLNDGNVVELDLNGLKTLFYEKSEVDSKFNEVYDTINEKDYIKWNDFK